MQKPLGLKIIAAGLIKTKHVQFSIFTNEDVFFINQGK